MQLIKDFSWSIDQIQLGVSKEEPKSVPLPAPDSSLRSFLNFPWCTKSHTSSTFHDGLVAIFFACPSLLQTPLKPCAGEERVWATHLQDIEDHASLRNLDSQSPATVGHLCGMPDCSWLVPTAVIIPALRAPRSPSSGLSSLLTS